MFFKSKNKENRLLHNDRYLKEWECQILRLKRIKCVPFPGDKTGSKIWINSRKICTTDLEIRIL